MLNYHSQFQNSVQWRLTLNGVEVESSGIERTPGAPKTVTKILTDFRDALETTAQDYRIPVEALVACIATESSGNPLARRQEPGYISDSATPHRVSVGLMQTLLSTASEVMDFPVSAKWLQVPDNSIYAGARYIKKQSRTTHLDPPLVFAAYNAGGVYYQKGIGNRWKLRQFPIGTGKHVDRAIRFLNDAIYVTSTSPIRTFGWRDFIQQLT